MPTPRAPPKLLSLDSVLKADHSLGYTVYSRAQKSSELKLVAEACSLSGDEVLFFGFTAVLGSVLFALRGLGYREMGCVEECCWDCFGGGSFLIMVETGLKWVFRRERPSYAPQAKVYSIPGEWFSFPSGHTMRAFYLPFLFSTSPFLKALGISAGGARYAFPWACSVGWSRVAKGRHYPIDCFVGGMVGVAIGYAMEILAPIQIAAVMKTMGGVFVTYFYGFTFLMPALAGKGEENKASRMAVGFVYYGFYTALFLATLPWGGFDQFGKQTLGENGACTNLW